MKQSKMKRFITACDCLPPQLKNTVLHIENAERCEEIRLRACKPISVCIDGEEKIIPKTYCEQSYLQETLSRGARYSVHSYGDALAQGFIPLQGGHRLGICGTAVITNGEISGFRMISSLNIRIAQQHLGVADIVIDEVYKPNKPLSNILIISPPGYGKTTILRDIIRQISNQNIRIGVADERGEIAGMHGGVAQFDIGNFTDVIEQAPKAKAAMILLKTMSPQIIAMDEITSKEDIQAISYAGYCGVKIIASAHAYGADDLMKRPLYKEMLSLGIINKLIIISREGKNRFFKVQNLEGGN